MGEAKHTPGPWEVDGSLFKVGYFFKIVNNDGPVAEIGQCTDMDEELANANLIAAAPDLLAALEAVEWVATPLMGNSYIEICPWCNARQPAGHKPDCQRQAAIAKAKGERTS